MGRMIKEELDMADLTRRVQPPTPDKVVERLEKLQGGASLGAPSQAKKKEVSSDSDEELSFPSHES